MANCACHPLFCSVQQTVFDTVHTAVFSDTIHTVKVVTAKVKLDSTYSIDLLHKSQEFYSSSFNNLLVVITILIALFVLAMTLAWNKRFDTEVDKLHNQMKDEVERVSKKAFEESKKEFEQNVSDVKEHLAVASSQIGSLWPDLVMVYLTQARDSKSQDGCLGYCIFAFNIINSHFGENLLTEADLIIDILLKKFGQTIELDLKPELRKIVIEQIEEFQSRYFAYFVDKTPEEKQKVTEFMKKVNAVKSFLDPGDV